MNTTVSNAVPATACSAAVCTSSVDGFDLELRNAQGLTAEEEIANSITHGLGFVLSVVGFYYHLAELESARRCHIPVVILVNNNSGFDQNLTGVHRIAGDRRRRTGRGRCHHCSGATRP
jgi:hypothetical protein